MYNGTVRPRYPVDRITKELNAGFDFQPVSLSDRITNLTRYPDNGFNPDNVQAVVKLSMITNQKYPQLSRLTYLYSGQNGWL